MNNYTPKVQVHYSDKKNALSKLHGFSITGNSKEMRQQMLDDTFVLKDIAILGQWTTIYAAPNTGKTLLSLWLLKEALEDIRIDGHYVFYVNADDNFKGIVEKTELAEKWGFHMLAPNHNGFNSIQITSLMSDLAETGHAKGVVIILDTLKKFTDLMQKQEATQFGIISRGFVSAGGTLICLAHTNKHKSADGKPIYGGTSDIKDDSDCVFIIDKTDDLLFGNEVIIEFTNDKSRGDVASSVNFSYIKKTGLSYAELVESIKRINSDEATELKFTAEKNKQIAAEQRVIEAISNAINQAIDSKSAIIKFASSETGLSNSKVREILQERTGANYSLGHRWISEVGAHNKTKYTLLVPTELSTP